ncbi:MAG TPA: IPT/TIG domain-containing protein [Geothermobacteraceae bacterium]|nr:IPT/TIG domain-containing protein [Geothermobacteraceae bacterium]
MPRVFCYLLLIILLTLPRAATALQLSSLQPTRAVPGEIITLGGSNWPADFQLLLGERVIPFERVSATEVSFQVPNLPTGEYVVGILPADATTRTESRFTLSVAAPTPQIESIDPDQLPACRNAASEVVIHGRNIGPSTQVLLNDGSLAVKSRSSGSIAFLLPQVAAGLQRIQLVNPDGQRSLPANLEVTGQPQIDQLEIGGDQVLSYQIRILGVNFSPRSRLLVNGVEVINHPGLLKEGDDRISYLNCSTLLYQRYPLSGQVQDLEFQVQNPDGQVSNSISLNTN